MRKLLSYMRRGIDDFEMIQDGDKICVGVSAGKDSLTLLTVLAELRRFYPKKYDIIAVTVDMGFDERNNTPNSNIPETPPLDLSAIQSLCDKLGIQYIVYKTQVAQIIFDIRKESNPCSLCAKMRRGILNNVALENGCNKVALGHHYDDAIETFFLSLFFEGRISCFQPVTHLDRKDISIIRPLIYVPENVIIAFAKRHNLPVIKSCCPANGFTQRENIKQFLKEKNRVDHKFKDRIFGAIKRSKIDGWGIE